MDLLIKFLADGLLLIVLAIAGLVMLFGTSKSTKLRGYPYLIMAGLTSLLAGKIMSLLYQPAVARPFLEHGTRAGAAYIDNPGFPSDHALLATAVVVAVAVFVQNRNLTIILAVCVGLMGAARVAALVHTPLDVIAGIIAGLIGGLWYLQLIKKA